MTRHKRLPDPIIRTGLNESVVRCLDKAQGETSRERLRSEVDPQQQNEERPTILRQSVEVLRYIGGTRRYRVRADFLLGPSIRICPVEIAEKTNDLPHLPWRWWAKRFQYEIKCPVPLRDLDWAYEVLREWARPLISQSCHPAPSAGYPCGYCAGKWPDRPVFWGNPAAPCSVCAVNYPWLLD